MRITALAIAFAGLTACGTRPPTVEIPAQPAPVGAADTCGSAPYGYLVGEKATALERVLILRQVRVIWPEDEVIENSRPERINFYISANGIIQSITCG